jgi:hypothetical protein
MTMVHLIQAKRSPVSIDGVMAAVVASALMPLVVQVAGGGCSDFASIGATFRWPPVLVGLHLVTDVLIGLSYVVISATLMQLARKAKQDMPFLWAFVAFGIFIVSCGRGSAVMNLACSCRRPPPWAPRGARTSCSWPWNSPLYWKDIVS